MARLRRTIEIAQEYYLQERFEEAMEHYLEMDRISEPLADAWPEGRYRSMRGNIAYNIAACFHQLSRHSEAQRWYREAAARYGPDTEGGRAAQAAAEVMGESAQKVRSGKGGEVGGADKIVLSSLQKQPG
jgi:tetratricopeptide (TPR) repeat protein